MTSIWVNLHEKSKTMNRSEINKSIIWAKSFLAKNNITLPVFGYWSPAEWEAHRDETDSIRKLMLGWDVTDYGLDRFDEIGGVLFTIRNGDKFDSSIGTPYAEKYIILKKGQKLPLHMHKDKTEDIINRCGGTYSIKLYASNGSGDVDYEADVCYVSDGITHVVPAGSVVDITTGNSITLTPGLYHAFWAKDADVVIGEVSSINDDNTDNYFAEEVARFSTIVEDDIPVHPLCNEYA